MSESIASDTITSWLNKHIEWTKTIVTAHDFHAQSVPKQGGKEEEEEEKEEEEEELEQVEIVEKSPQKNQNKKPKVASEEPKKSSKAKFATEETDSSSKPGSVARMRTGNYKGKR